MQRMYPRMWRRVFAVVAIAIMAAIAVWGWTTVAHGGRTYFSPDTFQVRFQSEVLLPLSYAPAWRSSFTYRHDTYPLVEYLVSHGFWAPVATPEPRWILLNHWNVQWRDGHSTLYKYLKSQEWIEWTESHPDVAKVLWPNVLSLLRDSSYTWEVEHVMYLARGASTEAEWRELVERDPELQESGIRLR